MMNYIRFEAIKIFSHRVWRITIPILLVLQPIMALLNGMSMASIGLDATPETHPNLWGPLPPAEYFGFDIAFGQILLTISFAVIGASEYRNHELRTTFLSVSRRIKVYLAKLTVVLFFSFILSAIATYLMIIFAHIGLRDYGLNLIVLSPQTWRHIGLSVLNLTLLSLLSLGLGTVFRNMIIPLLLILPQIMGAGILFFQDLEWFQYLPIVIGNQMFAVPTMEAYNPLQGSLIMGFFAVFVIALAIILTKRQDVGERY